MATRPLDGNRVGAIIQSMFARIKYLWVCAGRKLQDAESVVQRHARRGARQLRRARSMTKGNGAPLGSPRLAVDRGEVFAQPLR
jgi:hypothetical protein